MEYPMDERSALQARFDKLQERLKPLWKQIGRSDPGSRDIEEHNTVVVAPSLTVDIELDMPSQQVYEERMLFMLFMLRQPRIRLIYLTSVPVPDGSWDPYAIEINLRKGGTTHPFLTLQYLTDGKYDAGSGVFLTALGHPKYYVATDTTQSDSYRAFTPEDLFDIVSHHRLHYDPISQTGIVLHVISSVGALGKLGLTAIGDTPEHAAELYHEFLRLLDETAAGKR